MENGIKYRKLSFNEEVIEVTMEAWLAEQNKFFFFKDLEESMFNDNILWRKNFSQHPCTLIQYERARLAP